MKGVRLRGQLTSGASTTDATLEIGAGEALRLKASALGDPFLVLLSPSVTDPLSGSHEFVRCTDVADDGTLVVLRGQESTSPGTWPVGTRYLAAPKGGFLEAHLLADLNAADRELTVDVQSAFKMPVPTPPGQTLRDGPFKLAVTDGTAVEWLLCTANPKTAGRLTVTRGVDGTAAQDWLVADDPKVITPASGHKRLDARALANTLAKGPRGPIHQTLFNRLRKPPTLYERTDFRKFQVRDSPHEPPPIETIYPREFGRRMTHDAVDSGSDFSSDVNIDPAGSLARYYTTFIAKRGNACHGRTDMDPDPGKVVPPILEDEDDPPNPDIWGSNALDHARRLDDYYWIVSEADMPMLKEYALTHIQYAQFEYWAKGKVDKGRNPRWAPLFEVVFKGSRPEKFFKETHTTEEYVNALLTMRPRYAPAFLDMASMNRMLGGSFLPGIEIGREAGKRKNWSLFRGGTKYFPDLRFHPQGLTAPNRPGTLTKDLAIPWFADYIACAENFWPTSRPQIVYQEDRLPYSWLLTALHGPDEASFRIYWTKLGFIRRQPDDSFFEEESLFARP
jgi:hypothetical protein